MALVKVGERWLRTDAIVGIEESANGVRVMLQGGHVMDVRGAEANALIVKLHDEARCNPRDSRVHELK